MDTNWPFQEPIDLEHKQYILLSYLQKIDKDLSNFKLYPNFQFLSLHLANINLMIQKGQFLMLTKKIKEKDEEILISDLVAQDIPLMTQEDILEVYKICKFSSQKLQEFFDQAKAIWELVNDAVSLTVINNQKSFDKKEGLFIIENNGKNFLYEFIIKEIKKNTLDLKCQVKKICEVKDNNLSPELFENRKSLIKNLQDPLIHKNIIVFKVNHDNNFPFNETLLPISKRKILNYIQQSKILSKPSLTKSRE